MNFVKPHLCNSSSEPIVFRQPIFFAARAIIRDFSPSSTVVGVAYRY
jgi:hypothetical protein